MFSALTFANPTPSGPFSIFVGNRSAMVAGLGATLPDDFHHAKDPVLVKHDGQGSSPSFAEFVSSSTVVEGLVSETPDCWVVRATNLDALFADCGHLLNVDEQIAVVWENPVFRFFANVRARLRGEGRWESAGNNAGTHVFPMPRTVLQALKKMGYANITAYSIGPTLSNPSVLRPFANIGPLRKRAANRAGPLRNLLRSVASPAYLVVAAKDPAQNVVLLDRVMDHVVSQAETVDGDGEYFAVDSIARSAKEKFIVSAQIGNQRIIVRLPCSSASEEVERKAYGLLKDLQSNTALTDYVPRPVCEGRVVGQQVFAESMVAGQALWNVLKISNRASYVGEVNSFLRALNPSLPSSPTRSFDGDLMERMVSPVLERVLNNISDANLRQTAQRLVRESLGGAASRVGLIHGDFSVRNIFVDGGKISGVIDWENNLAGVPPVLDVLNYLDSAQRVSDQNLTLADTIPALASGSWPVEEELSFLKEFFRFCDIEFQYLRGFALLYFLFHIGPQLSFGDPGQTLERRVSDVIKRLAD